MTPTWYISIPIWGGEYVETFLTRSYPTLRAALAKLPPEVAEKVHVITHSLSNSDLPGELFPGFRWTTMTVDRLDATAAGGQQRFRAYVASHQEVVDLAQQGDWFSCLNADFAYSGNFFTRIHEHLTAGKVAVTAMGMRTMLEVEAPPVGAVPRDLLKWGWHNRHPITMANEWGRGRSDLPAHMFWTSGFEPAWTSAADRQVVGRAYHLHPVGVVKGVDFHFESIDADVLAYHDRECIHVVTDPDDLAVVEMSNVLKRQAQRDGGRLLDDPVEVARVLSSWRDFNGLYRWQLGHRIVLVGDGSGIDEQPIVNAILKELGPA